MGVPITFLDKHNPDQFEIVKFRKVDDEKDLTYTVEDNTILTPEDNYAVLQNPHQAEDVTELSGCQSPSSTNITPASLKSSEQLKAKVKASQTACGTVKAELPNQLSMDNASTSGCSFAGKCNGVMGVPVTFLDKYNPRQFEILELLADKRNDNPLFKRGTPTYLDEGHKNYVGAVVNGKATYARILIRRRA